MPNIRFGDVARPHLRWLFMFALANLPFWLLGTFFFVDRPWISFDAMLAVLLMALVPPAGAALLLLAWTADGIYSASKLYFFSTPEALLAAIGFLRDIDLTAYLRPAAFAGGGLFAACAIALAALARRGPHKLRAGIAWFAVLFLVDTLNGSSIVSNRSTRLLPANVGGSPLLSVAVVLRDSPKLVTAARLGPNQSARDLVDLPAWARAHPEGRVFVVLVESFGQHHNAAVRDWLRRQLIDNEAADRFDVHAGESPFSGSTTAGELRILCGLSADYRRLDAQAVDDCLPRTFSGMGWKTFALHGFSQNMFDRQTWWPMLGFIDVRFAEQMIASSTPQCGSAFRGVCDDDVLQLAAAEASMPKTFIYVLTLNTHLPLTRASVPPDLSDICRTAETGPDVCNLIAGLGVALRSVRTRILSQDGDVAVLVAGDHAPPFARHSDRVQFSLTSVPALALLSRRCIAEAGPRRTCTPQEPTLYGR